ncbi:MAG: FAD-dependent oxidoreductase [Chloroflexota bacterium]
MGLAGVGRDYPPTDEAGFLAYAHSLGEPSLDDALRAARPLTPIRGYRTTENRLRHYDRLRRRPERFVLLGDAVCAFNPVYGQGMTVAAQGALALDSCLREQRRSTGDLGDLVGLARRFQRKLARITATPWLLATGEDYRVPQTEGGQPGPLTRLLHRYMDRVMLAAAHEPRIQLRLGEVLHLLAPPHVLFHPAIAARALRPGLQPALRADPVPSAP